MGAFFPQNRHHSSLASAKQQRFHLLQERKQHRCSRTWEVFGAVAHCVFGQGIRKGSVSFVLQRFGSFLDVQKPAPSRSVCEQSSSPRQLDSYHRPRPKLFSSLGPVRHRYGGK
ncbi:hypothetical protein AAFF_G00122570 [Aldrovandia affinis]|uniref:Uncharacterized protein n=1 Tax=Aldrovandia affinis TaxID=143900 RepID=A0AAD7RRZ8_9TELE|nr:hypothetical protein AAFF_G00122570 [Aldrovandia affinis]